MVPQLTSAMISLRISIRAESSTLPKWQPLLRSLSTKISSAPPSSFTRRAPIPPFLPASSSMSSLTNSNRINHHQRMNSISSRNLQSTTFTYINNDYRSACCHSFQTRQFASKRKSQNKNNDDNAPLRNEHLIAKLLTGDISSKKGGGKPATADVSAETFQVRLIVDLGRNANKNKKHNNNNGDDSSSDDDDDDDESDSDDEHSNNTAPSGPTPEIVSLMEAIEIANQHNIDLIEVALKQNPPVIKAVDFQKWTYDLKRKEKSAIKEKNNSGAGAISDKALKEFKFRAGIADHDLQRKAKELIKYLAKGHAIRVTLTARQRSLNVDSAAINTTLERVKELVGDRAVEAKGMKSNDRGSYGSLLLHPNKSSKN